MTNQEAAKLNAENEIRKNAEWVARMEQKRKEREARG
jgi:hypothetical protein